MIRLIIVIALLALLGTVAWMAWQWLKLRSDQQRLRENPPARLALNVRLPREADRSNVKMTRFFGRLERLMVHDPEAVANNDNVISAALVGSGAISGQAATVRFLIWTPPALAERVMMELQECYEGQAQITELKEEDDPLGQWLSAERSQRLLQAQQAEVKSEPSDDPQSA